MIEELKRQKRIHGLSEEVTQSELDKLNKGMPIQKIIGFIDFDNLRINVNKNVLIPRYETQELVEESLKYINKNSNVLDLCSGSGYIGLTIKQKTNASVTCSDISNEAITQIKENADMNNLDVKIINSDLFENINDKFDVIISNPPYIPEDVKLDKSVIDFEPSLALFAGKDGNVLYKKIINEYRNFLKPNGVILFEISEDNKEYIQTQGFEILKDINGKNRIAIKKTA